MKASNINGIGAFTYTNSDVFETPAQQKRTLTKQTHEFCFDGLFLSINSNLQ